MFKNVTRLSSVLRGVRANVAKTSNVEECRKVILDHLGTSHINDQDKNRMMCEIASLADLFQIQRYFYNCILVFEGLRVISSNNRSPFRVSEHKNREVTDLIDETATNFYRTKDKKYFEEFARVATPLIKKRVVYTCIGSIRWDPEELFSILLADMWRLFNVYEPEEGKKFHWLMFRQLKNKTINYIQNTTGRKAKHCYVCGTTQEEGSATCRKCKVSLSKPHANTGIDNYEQYSIKSFKYRPDYLHEIACKQQVSILLEKTKRDDPKTHQILTLFLEGYNKSEIGREVNIAQNALNYRMQKCGRLLEK